MKTPWFKNSIIYGVDIQTYMDSNGDGIGDFQGLINKLDYIADLGVDCLWLLPFYTTPYRDNGYDIQDYFSVDSRVGGLQDFIELVQTANQRGIRILIDLVMNHTSDQHPWFQASRRDPQSRYHDYYVWSKTPVEVPKEMGTIFPGEEESVWTFDEVAQAYFFHRFYHFEPALTFSNPQVREEAFRVMDFWLSFNISGFRLDAAPHMIEEKGLKGKKPEHPHQMLQAFHEFLKFRNPEAVFMAETDVPVEEIAKFFHGGKEMDMLFNFLLSEYLFLALATEKNENLVLLLNRLPSAPKAGQWVNFLRNLDELDLERLTEQEKQQVLDVFAPSRGMQIFGRGLRRRIAPMLGGDRRRMELAFSLLFSMPGIPMFVYGDEIGMGEDLSLSGRNAVRTPMQWSTEKNAGFSSASIQRLSRPVITTGQFAYKKVNVADQLAHRTSFLKWMKNLIKIRKSKPVIGTGDFQVLDSSNPHVFAHAIHHETDQAIFIHNLSDSPQSVEIELPVPGHLLQSIHGSGTYRRRSDGQMTIDLDPYGYLWLGQGE